MDRFEEVKGKYRENLTDEKQRFIDLISCVQGYSKDFFSMLENQVLEKNTMKCTAIPPIYSILVDNDSVGKYIKSDEVAGNKENQIWYDRNEEIRKRSKKIENNSVLIESIFWIGNKSEQENLDVYDTNYQGAIEINGEMLETNFRLRKAEDLMENEQMVNDMLKKYSFEKECPSVFSPMSKRLYHVFIDVDNMKDKEKILDNMECIKVHITDNRLKDKCKVTSQVHLIWNVHIAKRLPDEKKKNVLGDIIHYLYAFRNCKEHQYIVSNENAFETLTKEDREIQLNYTEPIEQFWEIVIGNVEIEPPYGVVFSNKMSKDELLPRLRSKANFEYTMKCFSEQLGIKFIGVSNIPENEELYSSVRIKRGAELLDCNQVGFIKRNRENRILLYYLNEEKSEYIEDYIGYVLEFLTYIYPEIYWEGRFR